MMEDIIATVKSKAKAKTTRKVATPAAAAAKKPRAAKKAAAPAATVEEKNLHGIIMDSLDQDKGQNILSIDLKGKTSIADFMIIVTGTSSRHTVSMAKKLQDKLSKEKFRSRIEGSENGDWVIVDAGDVIVHLFRSEVREFYNLEKLWASDFSTVGYNLYTTK
jgi:ribosome-associated protein